MAKFEPVHKYFIIFIALVACHGSLPTHGRKIKPLNQHSSLNTNTVANNPQPHLPSLKTNVESPHYDEANSLGDYTNAFRPTNPGGSPGVSHGIITPEEDNNNMKTMVVVQSPNDEVSVTEGSKDDFQPTDPGHSPGVGHGYQNKIGQGN